MRAATWCHCFNLCPVPDALSHADPCDPCHMQTRNRPASVSLCWADTSQRHSVLCSSFLCLLILTMINKRAISCACILCFNHFNGTQEVGWPGHSASAGSCLHVHRPVGAGRVKGRKEGKAWSRSLQRFLSPWLCLSGNDEWDHHKMCDIWGLALSPA